MDSIYYFKEDLVFLKNYRLLKSKVKVRWNKHADKFWGAIK